MRFRLLLLIALAACVTPRDRVPDAWLSVPESEPVRVIQYQGSAPRDSHGVRIETTADGVRLMRADKPLTDSFKAIESFDVSASRGEVAFSAKRDTNFDVGLVALEGSDISWVPSEPVDETGVTWAPAGNKIGFIVRGRSGDFVRVVHIPTSFRVEHDFTYAKIHSLGWHPSGDRFSVAYATPDGADRTEELQYEGRDRRITHPNQATIDAEVEPLGTDTILLRLRDIRYNETLPLVIWIDDEPFAWSDARAELMRSARVGLVVTKRVPGEEFWKSLPPWIDRTRTYVVAAKGAHVPDATIITGDAALRGSESRRGGNVVAVAPAVVQSVAARFIADQLKRITPPNGNSRSR